MIAIDLSNRKLLILILEQVNKFIFTANLDRAGNTTMFFIIEEAKETVLDFSKGTVKAL